MLEHLVQVSIQQKTHCIVKDVNFPLMGFEKFFVQVQVPVVVKIPVENNYLEYLVIQYCTGCNNDLCTNYSLENIIRIPGICTIVEKSFKFPVVRVPRI
jgi:hypothetical protein